MHPVNAFTPDTDFHFSPCQAIALTGGISSSPDKASRVKEMQALQGGYFGPQRQSVGQHVGGPVLPGILPPGSAPPGSSQVSQLLPFPIL